MNDKDNFEFQFRAWNPFLEPREEYEKQATKEFEKQFEIWLHQFDLSGSEKINEQN